MKFARRAAALAMMVLVLAPMATPSTAYADSRNDRCETAQQDDDCKEARKGFQTKFFSQ